MKTGQLSEKFRQKRKLLLLLPLLLLPFLTLLFWAAGGGKSNTTEGQTGSYAGGLNTQLPDAKLKSDKGFDKLSFYQQASKDSAKLLEEKRTDPYWSKFMDRKDTLMPSGGTTIGQSILSPDHQYFNPLPDNTDGIDANEAKVYSKLDQLKKALASSKVAAEQRKQSAEGNEPEREASPDSNESQLEAMMHRMQETKTEDPEIRQLNQMLDKIAAIQHPELVKDTMQQSYQIAITVR